MRPNILETCKNWIGSSFFCPVENILVENVSFSAKSEGRTCEYNGRIYQNGEGFRAGCKHQCTCIDGAVGCAPLCDNKLPPASPSCPYPRLVRIPGQCCFSVDCHQEGWSLPPQHQVSLAACGGKVGSLAGVDKLFDRWATMWNLTKGLELQQVKGVFWWATGSEGKRDLM